MAKKKVKRRGVRKKVSKRIKRARPRVKRASLRKVKRSVRGTASKIKFVFLRFITFLIFGLASYWVYSVSDGIYEEIFGLLAIIFSFVALALFISFLALVILKLFRK